MTKNGNALTTQGYGTLKFNTEVEANERLLEIYQGVRELVQKFKPDHVAIEKVFFAKNVVSALKLGQARGVAILAVTEAGVPVHEYSPNAVKQAVVGFGHADKEQVARMITRMLGVKEFKSFDSSDALAIAICHLHTYSYTNKVRKALQEL